MNVWTGLNVAVPSITELSSVGIESQLVSELPLPEIKLQQSLVEQVPLVGLNHEYHTRTADVHDREEGRRAGRLIN